MKVKITALTLLLASNSVFARGGGYVYDATTLPWWMVAPLYCGMAIIAIAGIIHCYKEKKIDKMLETLEDKGAEMKTCPYCEHEIRKAAIFCKYCHMNVKKSVTCGN